MKKFIRLRLLTVLVLACLLGSAIGMVARVPRYRFVDGYCEGFYVQGMWRKRTGSGGEFLYLLAFPDGEQHGGGATAWPLNSVSTNGVSCHPHGLYVQGKRSLPPNGYGVWVYLPTVPQGGVRFIEIPAGQRLNLEAGDFATLEQSPMWKQFIRPALVDESMNWSEAYEREHGVYVSPRFPRRDAIDWQNLDPLFPKRPP